MSREPFLKIFALTTFLIATTGCASLSNLDSEAFQQGDIQKKQFITDSAQCEMEGEKNRTMGGLGGLAGVMSSYETFNRVYDACMRSKGYSRK